MITYYKMISRKLNEVFLHHLEENNLDFTIEDVEVEFDEKYIDFTLSFEDSAVYFRLDTQYDYLYIHIFEDIYEDATLLELFKELYRNK